MSVERSLRGRTAFLIYEIELLSHRIPAPEGLAPYPARVVVQAGREATCVQLDVSGGRLVIEHEDRITPGNTESLYDAVGAHGKEVVIGVVVAARLCEAETGLPVVPVIGYEERPRRRPEFEITFRTEEWVEVGRDATARSQPHRDDEPATPTVNIIGGTSAASPCDVASDHRDGNRIGRAVVVNVGLCLSEDKRGEWRGARD